MFVPLCSFLATRVSLPWYHVAWFAVPIIGTVVFFLILWRVAYLPWRDWDLRADEVAGPYDVRPPARRHEDQVYVRTD